MPPPQLLHLQRGDELPFFASPHRRSQSQWGRRRRRLIKYLDVHQRSLLTFIIICFVLGFIYVQLFNFPGQLQVQSARSGGSSDGDAAKTSARRNGEISDQGYDAASGNKAQIAQPSFPIFAGPTNDRQKAVREAFQHAWRGYKKYAWGHDMLKPISKSHGEWMECGLTIIDSLDTILIMGLKDEFNEAKEWVEKELSFDKNRFVNLFETTIRVLGGLLSAYHLSGDKVFLDKAQDIGERLAGALNSSPTKIPFSDVNLRTRGGKQPEWSGDSSLSEVTSIQLEFRDLGRVLRNGTYEKLAFQVSEHLHEIGCKEHDGLCGMFLTPSTGQFRPGTTVTFGARADSYYEYLLKQWLQTGKTIGWLLDDYRSAMDSMHEKLWRRSQPSDLAFVGELLGGAKEKFSPKMDHLVCFLAGLPTSTPPPIPPPQATTQHDENRRQAGEGSCCSSELDTDAGNRVLVEIAAEKKRIPTTDIIYLEPDREGHYSESTPEGLYYMGSSSGPAMLTRRYVCNEYGRAKSNCTRAFNYLPVDEKLYGFYVGKHDHPPHINYELLDSFRLYLTVREANDEAELLDFQRCHDKVKAKMSKPGEGEEQFQLYAVIRAGIDDNTYKQMSTEERFKNVGYVGLTYLSIGERMTRHAAPDKNLFKFASDSHPCFLVVHTEREMSAGEAAYFETRGIALPADHKLHNEQQGAKWRELPGVTLDEEYRSTSVRMADVLDKGSIYRCDWSSNLKRNKDSKHKPDLTIDTTSPGRTRKKRKLTSTTTTPSVPPTPVSALDGFHFDSSPNSATVRTSTGYFSYDGTKEDLEAKRAEIIDALDEEARRLQQQEDDDEGDGA